MTNPVIAEVSDQSFEQDVINSDIPTLVDFWAEWCGPCRMLAPILESIANHPNYVNKLKIAKLNIENNKDIPAQLGIRSIPALMLYKDGKILGQKVGALSQSQLMAFLDEHLND